MAKGKYETDVEPRLEEVRAWCRDGATDNEIAERLGISKSAFYLYKSKHKDFLDSLNYTKNYCDLVEVVGAYLKRAKGYTVVEKTRFYRYDENGIRHLDTEREAERHIPGDPRAMENWLRLRQKAMYGDIGKVVQTVSSDEIDNSGIVMLPEVGEEDEQ